MATKNPLKGKASSSLTVVDLGFSKRLHGLQKVQLRVKKEKGY